MNLDPLTPAQWGLYYTPCHLPVGVNKNAFLPFKQKGFKYFLTWNHLHSGPDPHSLCSHLLRTREPLDVISKCAVSVSLMISLTCRNDPGSKCCATSCPPQCGFYAWPQTASKFKLQCLLIGWLSVVSRPLLLLA